MSQIELSSCSVSRLSEIGGAVGGKYKFEIYMPQTTMSLYAEQYADVHDWVTALTAVTAKFSTATTTAATTGESGPKKPQIMSAVPATELQDIIQQGYLFLKSEKTLAKDWKKRWYLLATIHSLLSCPHLFVSSSCCLCLFV